MHNWRHKVSLEWLKQRQGHLTASDVRSLVPFTKTGRQRNVTDVDRFKVMSGKLVELTESDCLSDGAAARGHMMEPYAISEFNKYAKALGLGFQLSHWDDVLISDGGYGHLAYSPDALDVDPMEYFSSKFAPSVVGEVKCYGHERHVSTVYQPKELIEERLQLAVAMAVSPTIEDGYLIFFNPNMGDLALVTIHYTRGELRDEIEAVVKVEKEWLDFLDTYFIPGGHPTLPNGAGTSCSSMTEDDIWDSASAVYRLNP